MQTQQALCTAVTGPSRAAPCHQIWKDGGDDMRYAGIVYDIHHIIYVIYIIIYIYNNIYIYDL
jgi:hypothetical protein